MYRRAISHKEVPLGGEYANLRKDQQNSEDTSAPYVVA